MKTETDKYRAWAQRQVEYYERCFDERLRQYFYQGGKCDPASLLEFASQIHTTRFTARFNELEESRT